MGRTGLAGARPVLLAEIHRFPLPNLTTLSFPPKNTRQEKVWSGHVCRDRGTFMARILCVDDEPHVVTLKCAILEAAGHIVTASTSAHDAIEKLESNSYDAVVTDWRLGDANGRAVVQAAKSHSTTPVVVVSGYVAEAFQAAEPLADLYLEKPVNPEELVTIVNELLKTSDRAASR